MYDQSNMGKVCRCFFFFSFCVCGAIFLFFLFFFQSLNICTYVGVYILQNDIKEKRREV